MTEPLPPSGTLSFDALAQAIAQTHHELAAQATRAVNVSLTLRNWLIGHHIAEYELAGSDRADYGERLLLRLAQRLRIWACRAATAGSCTGTGTSSVAIHRFWGHCPQNSLRCWRRCP